MSDMTRRILLGSLRHGKGRVILSVCAITLGTSLIVAAVNLRFGMGGKFSEAMRSYGSNLLLVPGSGSFLEEKDRVILEHERVKDHLVGYAPLLHTVVKIHGRDVVLVGTRLAAVEKISPWWQVDGRWPREKGEALVGFHAASKLGLRLGDSVAVAYKNSFLTFSISGLLRTGGPEEHQLFAELETVQFLTDLRGFISSVLVSSRSEKELKETVAFLRQAWPEAEIRTLLQVVSAEEAVLSRLEILFTLISLLVLFAASLSVLATMSRAAMERRVEMALMRALGAERKEVAWIFGFEAVGIGLIGGFLGCGLGLIFAQVIGLSTFGAVIFPHVISLPTGLIIGAGISLLSSLGVVRRMAATAPAPILKGE